MWLYWAGWKKRYHASFPHLKVYSCGNKAPKPLSFLTNKTAACWASTRSKASACRKWTSKTRRRSSGQLPRKRPVCWTSSVTYPSKTKRSKRSSARFSASSPSTTRWTVSLKSASRLMSRLEQGMRQKRRPCSRPMWTRIWTIAKRWKINRPTRLESSIQSGWLRRRNCPKWTVLRLVFLTKRLITRRLSWKMRQKRVTMEAQWS